MVLFSDKNPSEASLKLLIFLITLDLIKIYILLTKYLPALALLFNIHLETFSEIVE